MIPPATTIITTPRTTKSKVTAGVLGILLGGLGIHKFYMGKPGQGILYILFVWTWIPAIVGLIEGIWYLVMSEEDWQRKFSPAGGTTVVSVGGGATVLSSGMGGPSMVSMGQPQQPQVWMAPATAPPLRTCLGCGMGIDAGFNICPHCGKPAKAAPLVQ
jgi:TM2 domain-containing membrane protein YozV